jgi:hypothetical protein
LLTLYFHNEISKTILISADGTESLRQGSDIMDVKENPHKWKCKELIDREKDEDITLLLNEGAELVYEKELGYFIKKL